MATLLRKLTLIKAKFIITLMATLCICSLSGTMYFLYKARNYLLKLIWQRQWHNEMLHYNIVYLCRFHDDSTVSSCLIPRVPLNHLIPNVLQF